MKRKKERNKYKFLCTLHDSDSTKCSRKALVEESQIRKFIYKRYGDIDDMQIKERLDHIVVFDKLLFEIHFNEDIPIILSETFIQF